jgi:ankyrin repeat protein
MCARCVEILLRGKADISVNSKVAEGTGWTAMGEAAFHGHVACVRLLVGAGEDVNRIHEVIDGERTAAMLAAQNGHAELVRALSEMKADVGYESSLGVTALQLAAEGGHEETKGLILQMCGR